MRKPGATPLDMIASIRKSSERAELIPTSNPFVLSASSVRATIPNMAETPERTRRWFQFHLSSAIAMMFALALFMLLNVSSNAPRIWAGVLRATNETYLTQGTYDQGLPAIPYLEVTHYGWPLLAYPSHVMQSLVKPDGTQFEGYVSLAEWNYPCAIAIGDGLLGLMIVYFVGRYCEIRIRRRKVDSA